MKYILVCSCAQLRLVAHSSLSAAELPVSRGAGKNKAASDLSLGLPAPLMGSQVGPKVHRGKRKYYICKGSTAFS